MEISDCCGASIYPETDVCSDCKEHCTPEEIMDFEEFAEKAFETEEDEEYDRASSNKGELI